MRVPVTLTSLRRRIAVAQGAVPADLVFHQARVVDVFTESVVETDVAVADGVICGLGTFPRAREVVDLRGRYFLSPALMDPHTHVESTLLSPPEYVRTVVPRGTGVVVCDPHELGNVAGLAGIRFLLDSTQGLPLELYAMASSCVPSCSLESSGAHLGVEEVQELLAHPRVLGLAEVMNYPGLLAGEAEVLGKILAVGDRPIDGHAPGLGPEVLNAYLTARITSDHETVAAEEAWNKLQRGMFVMIREGSSERNLEALLSVVTDHTVHRMAFATDDRSAPDLLHEGHMDHILRRAVALGLDPMRAIRMATLNPAEHFRLWHYGAVAPGYRAHLVVWEDLQAFRALEVYHAGQRVAREGEALFEAPLPPTPAVDHTIRVQPFPRSDLEVRGPARQPVIQVMPDQILTRAVPVTLPVRDGRVLPDPDRDVIKAVVVERHRATGRIGVGFVRGFGLRRGALAQSVAHDAHNLVAVGVGDEDLLVALQEVIRLEGGIVVVAEGQVRARLPLPLAGLMSREPAPRVSRDLEACHQAARSLGCRLPSPFQTLAFIALPVIPEIRITDRGVVRIPTQPAKASTS